MTVKHFGWLSHVVSVTKRFRVIAERFENDRQAISSDRRGYAKVSLSCPHYLFKKRANGSCRHFFILYLSRLCLCALKTRVRNAPRRFFLSFFAGSCRRFFILYLSHLCLCALKIRVRNARRRFFSKFFCRKRFGYREKFDCRQVQPCGI